LEVLREAKTMRVGFIIFCVFAVVILAQGKVPTSTVKGETGVVRSLSDGVLYIGGIPHSIAVVETESGTRRVAVPAMSQQPVQVGESLSFSGNNINVNSELVINTQAGFLFRGAEKNMAAYMADLMHQAQAQEEESAKNGIPNAVPITVMETAAQLREKAQVEAASASQRRTDLLLTVLSIILALLAFERVAHITKSFLLRLKSSAAFRRRRRMPVEGAQQSGLANTSVSSNTNERK
jgi:hypothetical protein